MKLRHYYLNCCNSAGLVAWSQDLGIVTAAEARKALAHAKRIGHPILIYDLTFRVQA